MNANLAKERISTNRNVANKLVSTTAIAFANKRIKFKFFAASKCCSASTSNNNRRISTRISLAEILSKIYKGKKNSRKKNKFI